MTAAGKIKLLIVDDHQVVRQGLRTFFELLDDIDLVGETGDGISAVEMVKQFVPDIVLMDLVMPHLDGIEATRRIKALDLGTKVIAFTSFTEDDKVFPAIEAGASSYLLKDVSPDELIDAIRAVYKGEARLHPDITRMLMDQVARNVATRREVRAELLTDRELEIVRLVAQGCSNQEIAQKLVISGKTVKTHVSNIMGKLNVEGRTQLAIYAIKNGLTVS